MRSEDKPQMDNGFSQIFVIFPLIISEKSINSICSGGLRVSPELPAEADDRRWIEMIGAHRAPLQLGSMDSIEIGPCRTTFTLLCIDPARR